MTRCMRPTPAFLRRPRYETPCSGLASSTATVTHQPAGTGLITGELIMVRSDKTFPEAMLLLQDAIKQQGYRLSRVQRVDIGLTKLGYQTDKYRVVFFGKTDEIHYLTRHHPELIPYLPLKIAIFAEAEETLLVTSRPGHLYGSVFQSRAAQGLQALA